MDSLTRKKLLLFGVKYSPTLFALSTSVKIFLLSMNGYPKSGWLYSVNWINLFVNAIILTFIYQMGKYFGYCWKHRSLCRITFWGFAYYGAFLLLGVPPEELRHVTAFYVLIVLVFTIIYKETK